MDMYRFCMVVWLAWLLSACQSVSQLKPNAKLQSASIAEAPPLPHVDMTQVPSPQQLTQLSDAQLAAFDEYMQRPSKAQYPVALRLAMYMDDVITGFEYRANTYSARETLEKNAGNCLSLALLAKALADHAQVPISFRVTFRDPVLDVQQGMMISSAHVRSYLHDNSLTQSTASATANATKHAPTSTHLITIDYFKQPMDYLGPAVSNDTFMAMVYNNFAAEALLANQQQTATAYTVAALRLDDNYAPSINLMAVLTRRERQYQASTAWYQYGLQRNPADVMLLSNYQLVATDTGDQALQQQLQRQIDELPETDNPYEWYSLAVQAEHQGQAWRAMHYYRKLLSKAPYLLPANQALVRMLVERQQFGEAQQLLQTALEYSYSDAGRSVYQQKLDALRQLRKSDHLE